MSWYIYFLLCDKKYYYVGLTSNIVKRLQSHKNKYNLATRRYSDIKMIYYEKLESRISAEKREKQIKGWSRAKKKALIDGDKKLLVKLSKPRALLKCKR